MSAMYDEPGLKQKPYQLHAVMVHEGEANQAGLEKTRFFLLNPAQWFFWVFWVFLFFFCFFFYSEERVFRVFQFQEYFLVHRDFKNYNHSN
jgi:hypothetical protein